MSETKEYILKKEATLTAEQFYCKYYTSDAPVGEYYAGYWQETEVAGATIGTSVDANGNAVQTKAEITFYPNRLGISWDRIISAKLKLLGSGVCHIRGKGDTSFYGNAYTEIDIADELNSNTSPVTIHLFPSEGGGSLQIITSSGNLGPKIEITYVTDNEPTVQSICVSTPPQKTEYVEGTRFDTTGMVVTADYGNGVTGFVAGYAVTPITLSATTDYVTITYKGKTYLQDITVISHEDYLRLSKPSADYGNNPKVNLATGRLNYVMPDLSVGVNSFKIDVSHVYVGTAIFKAVGNCWKLNVQQYVIPTDDGKISYVDANGNVIDFVLFDSENQRYNDMSGKGLILYADGYGYTIKDDYGNLIKFNATGNICETVSAINANIKKIFEYNESNQLRRIYDARDNKTYILFEYDTGFLTSMGAYSNSQLVKKINFTYMNGTLQQATAQVGTETKAIAKFEYQNYIHLQTIIDCTTKQAVSVLYDNHFRVTRLSSGIVGEQLTFESFTEKDYVTFAYQSGSGCATFSRETVVTNKKSISQVAFVNTQSELVSTFEKVSDGLKTLTKEAGHYIQTYGSGTSFNGGKTVSGTNGVNITSSTTIGEEAYKNYAFTCWLKHNANCSAASAFLTFTCNGTLHTYSVPIDPYAKGCWQLVSIPITLGENKTLTNVSLKVFCAGGATSIGTIKVAEARVMPQEKITYIFYDVDVALDKQINLILETETEELDIQLGILSNNSCIYNANSFITFNDIYRNLFRKEKSSNGYYDFVYCNGVKTIKGVKSAMIYDVDCGYDIDIVSDLSTFGIRKESIDGLTVTSQTVKFGTDRISTLTNAVRYAEADDTEALVSSDAQTDINYYGQKLSAKDAYGVTTKYTYDNFGNVTSVDLIGSDGGTLNVQSNSYDENSQYLSSQTCGANTCNFTYKKPFDLVESQSVVNDTLTNFYGAFFDSINKVTRVKSEESYGEKLFTYENGLVRTISDGNCKLGAQYDPINDAISFSVFNSCADGAAENVIQKNSITDDGDERILKKTYYNTVAEETVVKITDKYGKTKSVLHGGLEAKFEYEDVGSSQASWPVSKITDDLAGVTTTYKFDDRNNVCGWETTGGLNVDQITPTKTKYTIEGFIELDNEITYDSQKAISPRVKSTVIGSNAVGLSKEYDYDEFGRFKNAKNSYSIVNTSGVFDQNYYYNDNSKPFCVTDMSFVCTEEDTEYDSDKETILNHTYDYFGNGNLKSITETGSSIYAKQNSEDEVVIPAYSWKTSYTYDNFNRITSEINTTLGVDSHYTYIGNRIYTAKHNGETYTFEYNNKGQLKSFSANNGSYNYTYDNYGNRKTFAVNNTTLYSLSWGRGNLLNQIKFSDTNKIEYKYNYLGMRAEKKHGAFTTKYHYDGTKLLGEDRIDSAGNVHRLWYYYDINGICGFLYGASTYSFVKDILGNVVMLINNLTRLPVARYYYDAFGNCKVLNPNGTENTDANFIGNINPIRWKGYYYDDDIGTYYINGRNYDPAVGKFLDADKAENILRNISAILPLDRNGILCDNILNFPANQYNILLQTYLYADPEVYEPTWIDNLVGWWNDLHWGWKVGGTIVFVAALAVASYYTGGIASTILAEAAKTAAISAPLGFLGGGMTFTDGQFGWDINSAANGAVNGAITGAIAGGLGGAVSNVGKGLNPVGKALVQGGLNAAIAGGVTAANGLITGDFSWTSVGIATVFGFFGGWFGTLWKGWKIVVSSVGLGIAEASIGELIEFIESKYNFNFLFAMPHNYV